MAVAASLAVLALDVAAWARPDQADDATAAAGIGTVAVDVVVSDREGQPVTGLTAKDFVLREDGALQDLSSFEAVDLARETAPGDPDGRSRRSAPFASTNVAARRGPRRTFVLVFDDLHLGSTGAANAKRAVGRFLETGTRPGDLVTLAVPGTGLVWSAVMPEQRAALDDVLRPIRGQHTHPVAPITDSEAVRIVKDNDAGAEEVVRQRFQLAGTLPADDLIAAANSRPGGRRLEDVHHEQGQLVQSEARRVLDTAQRQRRRVLEVTTSVLEGLSGVTGRKSVLLVSEGFVHDPDDPQLRELVAASRKGNAALYYLDVRGLTSLGDAGDRAPSDAGRSTRDDESEGAEIAATDTGGFTLRDAGDLPDGLALISRESSTYYLLGYSPTNPQRDGRFRRISVEATRPDLKVRARAGYYAPSDATSGADKATRKIDPQLESALRRPSAIEGIPLRLAAFAFQPVERGRTRVTLASEIGVKDLTLERGPDGAPTASVDVAMAIVHTKPGGSVVTPWREWKVTVPAGHRDEEAWAPLQSSFELPPGRCQAKLIVRDRKKGTLGSVIHTFEVPEQGAWRISSPVLSDTPTESEGRPRLLTSRDFPAEGKLYCYFEVYDAARDPSTGRPRVSYSYSLVDGAGQAKLAAPPAPVAPREGGGLARLVEIPLGHVLPGEYDLVLNVRDEAAGRVQELREPFRVRPTSRTPLSLYADLVRAFREGRASDATSQLGRWSPEELAKGAASLPAGDEALRRAALLMHTDIAIDLRQRGAVAAAGSHLATARALLDTIASPELLKDWLLAVGFYHQSRSASVEALAYFTECARLHPDAAEAWLGEGAAHEYTAYPDGIGGERLPEAPHPAAQEAERSYREAIRLAPGLAEARLRLGRVLRLAGRLKEAEQEFAAAIATSREGYVTGLAHLFWGELREEREDLAGAIAHYQTALEADPELQPAALALSHALRVSGRAREAAEILPAALRAADDAKRNPWLEYHLGLGRRYRPALAALREDRPAVAAGSTP